MKTAVLTLDGFKITEEPIPEIQDNEILVKTLACGVCSGDLFVYQNRPDFVATYNRLGHEATGQVTAVGPQITQFAPGDIVTALSLPAYADYFVATPDELVKLPPGVNPTALGEAIACCVHAASSRLAPGPATGWRLWAAASWGWCASSWLCSRGRALSAALTRWPSGAR
ncbi:MAG: alcohol dehydrogenase catalytic domain-containing protein [Chloroflexota bacterium]